MKSRPQKRSYIFSINHSFSIALVIGIITCLMTDCMGQKGSDHLTYETPGVLMASDVLPPELKWGKNYSVRGVTASTEDTNTLGYTHRFEITSIYGNFEWRSMSNCGSVWPTSTSPTLMVESTVRRRTDISPWPNCCA